MCKGAPWCLEKKDSLTKKNDRHVLPTQLWPYCKLIRWSRTQKECQPANWERFNFCVQKDRALAMNRERVLQEGWRLLMDQSSRHAA